MMGSLAITGALLAVVTASSGPIDAFEAVFVATTSDGSQGTAFAVQDGVYVTAAHVVESSDFALLSGAVTPRTSFSVRVRYRDVSSDLAILVSDEAPARAVLSLQTAPQSVGGTVYAVGSPIDGVVLSQGEVVGFEDNGWIVSDTPVDPGNSGGPLLNEAGDVVGVVVQETVPGGRAVSVPASVVADAVSAAESAEIPSSLTATSPENSGVLLALVSLCIAFLALVAAVAALVLAVISRRRDRRQPLTITLD